MEGGRPVLAKGREERAVPLIQAVRAFRQARNAKKIRRVRFTPEGFGKIAKANFALFTLLGARIVFYVRCSRRYVYYGVRAVACLVGDSLWNATIACGMLLLLVECYYCLWNVTVACGMLLSQFNAT